ncbi:MAG: extracellular solute-binding protein [Propionicimonas sp.]
MARKRLTVAAAIAVIPFTFALAACSSSSGTPSSASSSNAKVTDADLQGVKINLGDFFGDCIDAVGGETDVSKASTECEAMRILTNKFNAENKWGITVSREGGAEWKSYYDAVNSSFAAKEPPNILLMHESNIADYSTRGLLLPLDDQYAALGLDTSDMTEPAKQAVTIDDTLYAVPLDEHANLAHVNLDLMTQAGLVDADGQPVMPTSPDELKQQAAQFKAATGKQYIAWANDFNIPFRIFSSLVAQQGTPVVADDGTVSIDTDAGKKALTLIQDLYSSDIANQAQTYDASQQAFLNSDVGILVNGTWVVNEYSKSAKFTYEATNFPTLYANPGVWANSHTWVIPVQTEADPVKYRAAMEFAAFMYENDIWWAKGTGHLPVRPSVLSSPDYQAAAQRANYVATADNAALVPQVKGWQGAEDALQHAIETVSPRV